VIVDKVSVDAADKDGLRARSAVLGRLLTAIHSAEHGVHPPVSLAVIEEQRVARINNFDRTVRKKLIDAKAIAESMTLLAISPGSEHLLWLPDPRLQRLPAEDAVPAERTVRGDRGSDTRRPVALETANPRLP
jgi:hypothetical protein